MIYVKPTGMMQTKAGGSQPPPKYQAPTGTSIQVTRPKSLKLKKTLLKAEDPRLFVLKETPNQVADVNGPTQKKAIKITRPKSASGSIDRGLMQLKKQRPASIQSQEVKKPQADIPFAENRLKGQFSTLTKDLFKKA